MESRLAENLRLARGVPRGETALRVGVDQKHGAVAGAFCFTAGCFANTVLPPPLLRIDNDICLN